MHNLQIKLQKFKKSAKIIFRNFDEDNLIAVRLKRVHVWWK